MLLGGLKTLGDCKHLELLCHLPHHQSLSFIELWASFIKVAISDFDCLTITVTTIALIQLLIRLQLHRHLHYLLLPHQNLSPRYHSHRVPHQKVDFRLSIP